MKLVGIGYKKQRWVCFFHCIGPSASASSIDSGISSAVRDSSKLSMMKILHEGRMETTITAEKDTGIKRNSTDI